MIRAEIPLINTAFTIQTSKNVKAECFIIMEGKYGKAFKDHGIVSEPLYSTRLREAPHSTRCCQWQHGGSIIRSSSQGWRTVSSEDWNREGDQFFMEILGFAWASENPHSKRSGKGPAPRQQARGLGLSQPQNQHTTKLTLALCLDQAEMQPPRWPDGMGMHSLSPLTELQESMNVKTLRQRGSLLQLQCVRDTKIPNPPRPESLSLYLQLCHLVLKLEPKIQSLEKIKMQFFSLLCSEEAL